MRIFDETKTKELQESEIDLNLGHLENDTLTHHIAEQQEVKKVSHYETIREYKDSEGNVTGKDVKEVIDVPYQPYIAEHDEEEAILVYVLYTEIDYKKQRLANLESWFDNYFDYQITQHSWQGETYVPSYDTLFETQYEDWQALITKAQEVREEIIKLRSEDNVGNN